MEELEKRLAEERGLFEGRLEGMGKEKAEMDDK